MLVQQDMPWKGNKYYIILCVLVALGIQQAKCMYHIVCHLWFVWHNSTLPTLSHKWHGFRNKAKQHKMCSDFLYNVWDISHSKKNWGIHVDNCICVHVKYMLITVYLCSCKVYVDNYICVHVKYMLITVYLCSCKVHVDNCIFVFMLSTCW
jgi:hypothetical protein